MRAPESNSYTSATAVNSAPFTLLGGMYLVAVVASGFGTVKLQCLGPDGSTYLDIMAPFNNAGTEVDLVISTFAANGAKLLPLSPGSYRWTLGSVTNVFAELSRVPGE
jgi:hypothetical protein